MPSAQNANECIERLAPAQRIALISAGASVLNPRPRGLYISADGNISVGNEDGDTVSTIPVFAGTTIPLQPYKLTAGTGIYGLYY